MNDTEDPKKCHSFREDYLECLHHRKEVRDGAWTPMQCARGLLSAKACKVLHLMVGIGLAQFSRLNQIYRERQRQLALGIDVLKEDDAKQTTAKEASS